MPPKPTVQGHDNPGSRFDRALSYLSSSHYALISPHAVALDAGGKGRVRVHRYQPSGVAAEEQFRLAAVDLLGMIDASGAPGRRLRVVVSDVWARPLVLPPMDEMPSDAEMDDLLEPVFRRTYGDLMEGWALCWARQESRVVAVAWPAAGLNELREGMQRRGGSLASARPLAIDIAGAAIGSELSVWLVIIEHRSATLIRQQAGSWDDWSVIPIDIDRIDVAETLQAHLARETARRADDCRQAIIIDFAGAADVNQVREVLVNQRWTVRIHTAGESGASMAARLARAIKSATAA